MMAVAGVRGTCIVLHPLIGIQHNATEWQGTVGLLPSHGMTLGSLLPRQGSFLLPDKELPFSLQA